MTFFKIWYARQTSGATTYAGGQWVNWPTDKSAFCPICNNPKPETQPSEYHIELNYLGRKGFIEVLWNSHALPIFRSDVIDLWRSNGFTGFDTRPVKFVGWRGKKRPLPKNIPRYNRLLVTGRAILLSPPTKKICPVCGFRQYDFNQRVGIRVDETSWDRSDIFSPQGYEFVLCTTRVVEVTLQAGYKHITFVRSELWDTWEEFDVSKWDIKEWRKMFDTYFIRRVEDLDQT